MEFIAYLIKVNIAIILFYGFYRLLFRQDTFFRWKRLLLLLIFAISFLYPLSDFTQQFEKNQGFREMMENGIVLSYFSPEIVVEGVQNSNGISFVQMLLGIYILVTSILFLRLIFQLSILFFKIRKANPIQLYGQVVYMEQGLKTPFSFFKWILLDPARYNEYELKEILLHEETHVKQGHSLDTVFSELICVFCWFNPFVWLMRREVRMNLEFLADRSVIVSGCEIEHYQFHLLHLSYYKAAAKLSNNFNVSPLKKRIFMMNKKQTSKASILKYTLLLPIVGVLIFFNACLKTDKKDAVETVPVVEEIPAIPASEPEEEIAVVAEDVFSHVEEPPSFPGGDKALMQWLQNNIKYPEAAMEKGTQGRVIIRFIVHETGKVTDVSIVRSLDPVLDEEAVRVVNRMPDWTPGKQDGKQVSVYYTLPISFKLSK